MISRLQYITQDLPDRSHAMLAEEACLAGCTWIQLRVKNKHCAEWKAIALEVLEICREHEVKLIINDSMTLAKEIGADGVHLGKNDISTAEARRALGQDIIIGGTANTFEDIMMHAAAGVDYIGFGPFRFTATKEKLGPILGLAGYTEVMKRCREENIDIPVIAIGGILPEDVEPILGTGIHGVAVSSAITRSEDKTGTVIKYMSGIIQHLKKVNDDRAITNSR